jgi:ketosteroid isomerase-like protein
VDHHGEGFAVDLFKLWECGAIDLPAFAVRMVEAADTLVNIDSMYFGGGPGFQRIWSAWVQLADDLRNRMTTSVAHIYDTSDAVILIANKYADTDEQAGNDFRNEYDARRGDEVTKHAHDPQRVVFDTPSVRPQIEMPGDD